MTQSVRLKIIKNFGTILDFIEKRMASDSTGFAKQIINGSRNSGEELTRQEVSKSVPKVHTFVRDIKNGAELAKVIVFPAKQAKVFIDALGEIDFKLDYNLPFPSMLLQFSEPVKFSLREAHTAENVEVGAILLSKQVIDEHGSFNKVHVIYKDLLHFHADSWVSYDGNDFSVDENYDGTNPYLEGLKKVDSTATSRIHDLVIACIGYINCENVYLHPVESASEAINAKRERKGKSKLEPYYVCRIRGVQYNSDGSEKGTGSKQSIRYDVRGHFRRYESGKTTWVRAHQRGLTNELYVPKTYLVDKKAQA